MIKNIVLVKDQSTGASQLYIDGHKMDGVVSFQVCRHAGERKSDTVTLILRAKNVQMLDSDDDLQRETMDELPDSIRVPLHRIWADIEYLIGRAKQGDTELAVHTVKALCDEVERAVRAELAD